MKAETVAEVTAEVAGEVLTAHSELLPELAHVVFLTRPSSEDCARTVRCQPLPPLVVVRTIDPRVSDAAVDLGHLHQLNGVPGDGEVLALGSPGAGHGVERADPGVAATLAQPGHGDAGGRSLMVIAELITAGVARDVLDCEVAAERHRAEHLAVALASNRRIGMAVGIMMAIHQLTADQALEQLKSASQNRNRKLRDIAEDVVLTGALPAATPVSMAPDPRTKAVRNEALSQ